MNHFPGPFGARHLLGLALLIGVNSCVDAPFARVNPNDVDFPLELRVVGTSTTASKIGEVLLFQLVTTPATSGYLPTWSSSRPEYLGTYNDGRFRVNRLGRGEPVSVVVSAAYYGRFAEVIVTIAAEP